MPKGNEIDGFRHFATGEMGQGLIQCDRKSDLAATVNDDAVAQCFTVNQRSITVKDDGIKHRFNLKSAGHRRASAT